MKRLFDINGFSLIEIVVAIVVIGIIAAVALRSVPQSDADQRRAETEQEMEILAAAIIGPQGAGGTSGGFGFIGDVGAFPPDLEALYRNPGGYSTWRGPYLTTGLIQDSIGYRLDAWNLPYDYSGGLAITSNGGGSALTKQLGASADDFLTNRFVGIIRDASDSIPGTTYRDSICIILSIPDGGGGISPRTIIPNADGTFQFDSLPVGRHDLRIIYLPRNDTLINLAMIFPRHKSTLAEEFRFVRPYFSASTPTNVGTVILRPDSPGFQTALTAFGSAPNWTTIDEASADDEATYVCPSGTAWTSDTYSLTNPASASGTIYAVTVYCRAFRSTNKASSVRPAIGVGGVRYDGSFFSLTVSYTNYSHQWYTNPATAAQWNWSDITALQVGVGLSGNSPGTQAHCTQVWVEVAYGP